MVSNASEAPQFHEDPNCAEPDDEIDIEEEDKAEELAPLVVRSEQERRDHVEQFTTMKTNKNLQESKNFAVNSLTSISLTELQRLKADEQYSEDFTMTSSHYVKMCKKKDAIEDEALKLATENIKLAEDLEGDL